jgi:hypothetical protein
VLDPETPTFASSIFTIDVPEEERRAIAARAALLTGADPLCPGCTSPDPHTYGLDGEVSIDRRCPGIGTAVPGTHVCDGCKDAPRFGERVTVGIDPARDGSAAIAILRGGDVTIHGPIPARTVIGHVRDLHPEVTADDLDRWAALRPQVAADAARDAHEAACDVYDAIPEACWQVHPGGVVPDSAHVQPGDVAMVECSDGQWRQAMCVNFARGLFWQFPDGMCRDVNGSKSRPLTLVSDEMAGAPDWVAKVTLAATAEVLREVQADCIRERETAEEYAGGWSALWATLTDVHRDLSAARAAVAAMDGDAHAGRASAYAVILARLLAVLTEHVPPWDRDAADLLPEVEPEEEPTEEAPEEVPVSLEDALADPTLPSYAQLGLAGVQRRRRRAQVIAGPERPTAVNVFVTGGGATDARTVANGIVYELTRRRKVAGR